MSQSYWVTKPLAFFTLLLFLAFSIWSCGESDNDPRFHKLQLAINQMSNTPEPADSLGQSLKTIFGLASMDGFATDKFTYYTQTTDDRRLILVKIPELSSVQLSDRDVFLSLADKMTGTDDVYMKKYIGIFGRKNLMLVKTPVEEFNKSKVSKRFLYDYFGALELTKD